MHSSPYNHRIHRLAAIVIPYIKSLIRPVLQFFSFAALQLCSIADFVVIAQISAGGGRALLFGLRTQ